MANFNKVNPILILNMGGEMVYVLYQRLRAQKISEEKSVRVLNDVISKIFEKEFINSLYTESKAFTLKHIKSIFVKIAHCSIMKLNEASMGKLFDLMVMGIKYQLVASKSPFDIYYVSFEIL